MKNKTALKGGTYSIVLTAIVLCNSGRGKYILPRHRRLL